MKTHVRRGVVTALLFVMLAAGCSDAPKSDTGPPGGVGDPLGGVQSPPPAGGDQPAPPVGNGPVQDTGDAVLAGLPADIRDYLVDDAQTTWDVSYSADTSVVSGAGLQAIVDSDPASGTYTFDAGQAAAAGVHLTKGRVLLIAGQALRRITDVRNDGGRTVVTTEQAALADAIDEGTVGWDVPIRFDYGQFVTAVDASSDANMVPLSTTPQLTQIAMAMPDGTTVPVNSDNPFLNNIKLDPETNSVEWEFQGQDNRYQMRLTAKESSVDVLIIVSRYFGDDPVMALRAEGSIGAMRSTASNSFGNGSLKNSSIGLSDLGGELKLSISVAGAGVTAAELDFPFPVLRYAWMAGPIPVTVEVKAKVTGKVIANANSSARAKAEFKYSGDVGFEYIGKSVDVSANTKIDDIDPEPFDSAAPMGMDVDAQYGFMFPHVSMSIFGTGVVPHISYATFLGTSLEWGLPVVGFPTSSLCKSGYVRYEVKAGYDFKIFDKTLGSSDVILAEKRRDGRGDSCPPKD